MTATAPAAPAKVYFTNLRTHARESQLDKLKRLIRRAGIEQIDFENKFVAIKIHFGELGNLSFLRPNYAKAVADVVKELGGIPFLTDCNTLYVGRRKHALEHLEAAQENGFSPLSTGCQIIIADGLKGTDEVEVPVEGGEYVTAAKAMGVKESKIAFKHILPNVISIIIVTLTLDFAGCMLTESSLSYLGFGVTPPRPTWGNMLNGANNLTVMNNYWWQWLFTALFLAITTICINIIGDALRDVMDPKSNSER